MVHRTARRSVESAPFKVGSRRVCEKNRNDLCLLLYYWLNWGITRVWCAPSPRAADSMPFCFSGLCVSAVGMSSLRLSSPSQFGSKFQPTQRTPLLFVTVEENMAKPQTGFLLDEKPVHWE